MSEHKVDTVVEGTLTSLFVKLEDTEIGLSHNGDSFSSSDTLNIDGPLNLTFHARGFAFTAWKISITLDDGDEPLFKESGHLTIDNESILKKAIPLPNQDMSLFQKASRKALEKSQREKQATRKRADKR